MKTVSRLTLKALILGALSVVLSLTTVFLAPVPLLLLRRQDGRAPLLLAILFGILLLTFISPPVVIGTYVAAGILSIVLSECENQGVGYSSSVFVTVIVLVGLTMIVGTLAAHFFGFQPVSFFRDQIALSINQLKFPTEVKIDKEDLLRQVPSAVLMMIIVAVWLNSLITPRIENIFGQSPTKQKHRFGRREFLSWKLPDVFVWFALLSTAGNFLDFNPVWLKWVSTNAFNVCVLLYFFQGLAVVASYFETRKVSPLWKAIGYILVFTQFIAVAFIGFIDFWIEFRKRAKTDNSAVA